MYVILVMSIHYPTWEIATLRVKLCTLYNARTLYTTVYSVYCIAFIVQLQCTVYSEQNVFVVKILPTFKMLSAPLPIYLHKHTYTKTHTHTYTLKF